MNYKNRISNALIRRLPRYYRNLLTLQKSGVYKVSSKDLSDRMGITPSQVRADFTYFGGEGRQGSGYQVNILKNKIENLYLVDSLMVLGFNLKQRQSITK